MKAIWFSMMMLLSVMTFAAGVTHINNQSLKNLIEQGVPVIDVRTTSEWHETGIIEGSHLMMFYDEKGNYNLDEWLKKLSAVASKDKPVILICLSGSRSNQLVKYLNRVDGIGLSKRHGPFH